MAEHTVYAWFVHSFVIQPYALNLIAFVDFLSTVLYSICDFIAEIT